MALEVSSEIGLAGKLLDAMCTSPVTVWVNGLRATKFSVCLYIILLMVKGRNAETVGV